MEGHYEPVDIEKVEEDILQSHSTSLNLPKRWDTVGSIGTTQ